MPKTVLIVDDDALFREAIGDGLRAAGYHVVLAGDGLEALEHIKKAPPDFLLLDLIMPKLDGFGLCRLLKGHPQHRTIPVIILTGIGKEALKNLQDLGAEVAVAKRGAGATLTELRKTLQLLGSARLRSLPVVDTAADLRERRIVGELLAERHHVQAVLAHLGEGVLELDEGGQIVYLNPAALRMLAATAVDLLGTPGSHLLGPAQAPTLQQALREVQARGERQPLRLDVRRGQQAFGLTLTTLPGPGAAPGVLLVLRALGDLTRRA